MANILYALRQSLSTIPSADWASHFETDPLLALVTVSWKPATGSDAVIHVGNVNVQYGGSASVTTVSITLPSTLEVGETIVLHLLRTSTCSNPSGYTTVQEQATSDNTMWTRVMYKVATSGDIGATVQVTQSVSGRLELGASILRDADGWDNVESSNTRSTPSMPYVGPGRVTISTGSRNTIGNLGTPPVNNWWTMFVSGIRLGAARFLDSERGLIELLESFGHSVTPVLGDLSGQTLSNYDLLIVGIVVRDTALTSYNHPNLNDFDGYSIPIISFCPVVSLTGLGMASTYVGDSVHGNRQIRNAQNTVKGVPGFCTIRASSGLASNTAFQSLTQGTTGHYGTTTRFYVLTRVPDQHVRVHLGYWHWTDQGPAVDNRWRPDWLEILRNYIGYATGVIPPQLVAPANGTKIFSKLDNLFEWDSSTGQAAWFQPVQYSFRRNSYPVSVQKWSEKNSVGWLNQCRGVAFSRDGEYLAVVGDTTRVYSVPDLTYICGQSFNSPWGASKAAWNHDGSVLVTVNNISGSIANGVRLWSFPDWEEIVGEFPLETGDPRAAQCAYNHNGSLLAIGYDSSTGVGFKVYNTSTWGVVFSQSGTSRGHITLKFSPDGALFVVNTGTSTTVVYRTSDWEPVLTVSGQPGESDFSQDGSWLVVSATFRYRVYNVSDWTLVADPELHPYPSAQAGGISSVILPDKSAIVYVTSLIRGGTYVHILDTASWRFREEEEIELNATAIRPSLAVVENASVGPVMAYANGSLATFSLSGATLRTHEYWNGTEFQVAPATVTSTNTEINFLEPDTWDRLVAGDEYKWSIQLKNADGYTTPYATERVVILVDGKPLPTPTNTQTVYVSGATAFLTWNWEPEA